MTSNINLLLGASVAFIIGIISIPRLIAFSKSKKILNDVAEGDALKIHKTPTSLFGGLGMAIAMAVGVFFIIDRQNIFMLGALTLGFLMVFSLGFWDDVKWKHASTTKPFVKFFFLLVCTLLPAGILWLGGISISFLPFGLISILLGFLAIFLVINSVNYQDGMDGLAGGLVAISMVGFLVLGIWTGNAIAVAIAAVSLGAIASFLVFNLPPAKIFMGDAGSYQLGFLLVALAMMFSRPYNFPALIGPFVIIGLPIIDGVFTNVRRLAAGKSIFLGDRSHFYDKLMQRGFSVKKTLVICYFLQTVIVLMGIFIYYV